MEGGPTMNRNLYSLVLLTFLTVSCSPPGQDLQSAKPAPTATTETINKSADVAAAPAAESRPLEDVKPAEDVKPKRVEPAKPASTPRPAPAPLPAPPAPPAAATPPAPAP